MFILKIQKKWQQTELNDYLFTRKNIKNCSNILEIYTIKAVNKLKQNFNYKNILIRLWKSQRKLICFCSVTIDVKQKNIEKSDSHQKKKEKNQKEHKNETNSVILFEKICFTSLTYIQANIILKIKNERSEKSGK